MQQLGHPFPPVADEQCRILILGSFPSVVSREEGFFYGHPRNRFWPMLAGIFYEETPLTVPDRKALLLRHHLALWDVIASCRIEGSADASVRDATPVDIRRVLKVAPVERILCNGALAGRLYRRHLQPITGMEAIVLPSTSPANAAWNLPRLVAAWKPHLNT
ncbi:MAG: DNA-deoxyinosine glycosylase [Clostridiales bacterium]|nr:DNA-deoxyinosine glycosylase [Clostridiales bacterium]